MQSCIVITQGGEMKKVSDYLLEEMPQKPDPDQFESWKNSRTSQWLKAQLAHSHAKLLEQLADINFGERDIDLRELYVVQGSIQMIESFINMVGERDV
jgi:hypothetical protein